MRKVMIGSLGDLGTFKLRGKIDKSKFWDNFWFIFFCVLWPTIIFAPLYLGTFKFRGKVIYYFWH